MSARDELFRRVAGAFINEAKANALLDAYRAEVLAEAAYHVAYLLKATPEYGPWVADKLRALAAGGESRG
ncbi:hypothetical protein ACIGO7_35655 [Streptomyces virginiae]|uniref:hypothetical protein n=1 Tax=Streptomyces virginiae TaxID=1961 RepID=UPI00344EAA47